MNEEFKTPQDRGPEGSKPEEAGAASEQESAALKARVAELQQSVDQLRDQLLRKAAEFENYKRRVDSDLANIIKNANESLITALLPILNDFSRSLAQGKSQKDYEGFYRGVELIAGKLLRVLELQGLTPFDSLGKPFDVDYHDALLQVPRSDVPPHTVIEEVERGYKLNDKVLRHAKVIVSAAAELPENTQSGTNEKSSREDA